jgi:hypothetical protein
MAAGWPTKVTYANGDVYSASDVNDTNGTLNYIDPTSATDGQVLTRDNASAGKVKWATPSAGAPYVAGKNALINGGMDVWQRGTSVVGSATAYAADRWQAFRSVAGSTYSRQTTSDTTNLPTIQYCLRVSRDSGNTSTSKIYLAQSMESVNMTRFIGQTVTFSFYARRGANYSGASNALAAYLLTGTGTDQNLMSGYTGSANTIAQTATLTTTWTRYSYTATVPTTATELGVYFDFTPVGTAGAADFYEITGLQVELGSSASTFSRSAANYDGELAACQRYYYVHASGTAGTISNLLYFNSTTVTGMLSFPVTMRVAPTGVSASGTSFYAAETGSNLDYFNSITAAKPTTTATQIFNATEASGTVGLSSIGYTNNASASLAFNAEL